MCVFQWSFGVVMWELLTRGRTPYVMVQSVDLKDYINADNRLPHPETASQTVYVTNTYTAINVREQLDTILIAGAVDVA